MEGLVKNSVDLNKDQSLCTSGKSATHRAGDNKDTWESWDTMGKVVTEIRDNIILYFCFQENFTNSGEIECSWI